MSEILTVIIQSGSFRFSPLKCKEVGIALQEAKFLRWLYLQPLRSTGEIMATFGMQLAWAMQNAGYVTSSQNETERANTNLWCLTDNGVSVLEVLVGVK